MKKKLFLVFAAIFIVIIILFMLRRDKANQQLSNDSKSTTPYVTSASLNPKRDFIRNFNWKNIGTTMPTSNRQQKSEIKEVDGLTRKYSPNGNYSVYLTGQDLVVENNGGNQISVDITPETEAVNFVWLTNELVLLIEKEAAFRKIDRIYFIKAELGEKNFFAGSFPIKDRLNLDLEPIVFDDGNEVVFQDNSGIYWQLSLIY